MSNTISTLINAIGRNGLQPANLYSCLISDNAGSSFKLDPYLIDLTLPGPKYQFYTNTYWRGNWEYKQPVGIKYEDNLIMVLMVPAVINEDPANIFNLLRVNKSKFSYPGHRFGNAGSFTFNEAENNQSNQVDGFKIKIFPVNNKAEVQFPYIYENCFIEKILPFKFSAESDPPYQTMSILWTVGAETNRL